MNPRSKARIAGGGPSERERIAGSRPPPKKLAV
eukprot:SAG22_NODE_5890_length_935_cov_1.421053_1_plen_32_part_01